MLQRNSSSAASEQLENVHCDSSSLACPRSGNSYVPESNASPRHSIDVAGALERVGGDRTLLRELVQMFPSESEQLLRSIQSSCTEGDVKALERHAHTLKGMCQTFGANEAGGIAWEIEEAARQGTIPTVEQIQRLDGAIYQASDTLLQFQAGAE